MQSENGVYYFIISEMGLFGGPKGYRSGHWSVVAVKQERVIRDEEVMDTL